MLNTFQLLNCTCATTYRWTEGEVRITRFIDRFYWIQNINTDLNVYYKIN
jgi:hypothetical protein